MTAPRRPGPREGQVVTVFRNRLREAAREAYAEELQVVTALARAMPGFVETKTFVAEDAWLELVVVFDTMDEHRVFAVGSADDVGRDCSGEALLETALVLLVFVSVVSVSVNGLLLDDRFVERHVVVILATQEFDVVVVELVATFETIETAGEFPVRDEHCSHTMNGSLPITSVVEEVVEGFAMPCVGRTRVAVELTSRHTEPEEVFCLVSEGAF